MTPKNSKSYGLQDVNVSFLDWPKQSLPLVITPRFDDSLEFLCEWLDQNRPWAEEQILNYGAILIRGFQIDSAITFEKATLALQPKLCDVYRGTSPRALQPGTKFSFSAADVPVNYPIAQHLEMSFLSMPPRNLYFGCIKESTSQGGETALCDFRKVYKDLPPDLREKFATKKIKYTRKHRVTGEKWTFDVGAMLSWQALFGTKDKKLVEKMCQMENSPEVQWTEKNGDTFLQEWVDEPFQKHPDTNEDVWFNHSIVFHWTTFPSELWFSFCRIRDLQLLIHCLLISIFSIIKYCLFGHKMALNTTYGDGTPISYAEIKQVRDVVHKHMVFSRWQKGDILCIDNFSTSHGRQPTFDKGRKVIVAWGHPHHKASAPEPSTSVQFVNKTAHAIAVCDTGKGEKNSLPDLVAATPNGSPESSLTNQEAQELQELFQGDVLKNSLRKEEQSLSLSRANTTGLHKRVHSCPLQPGSDFWKGI